MLETDVRHQDQSTASHDASSVGAHILHWLLKSVSVGRLAVTLPSGATLIAEGTTAGVFADIQLKRGRALRRLLLSGDIGFAEGYRDGDWATSDLKALLLWSQQNEQALAKLAQGSWLRRALQAAQHRLRANTRINSRRNIAAHYDLGNAFYARWLDAGMNYSSGLYRHADDTLETAQDAKLSRVIELLDLKGGERVLEIGCGWGGLAERLAEDASHRVTALTLSAAQLDYAGARFDSRGWCERVDLRQQDYRDAAGTFDRFVSIEMLEAVGEQYWPVYFDTVRKRLAPGGKAVLQVITIDGRCFAAYRQRPDFIQTHIFPGGMLPTREIIQKHAEQAGLTLLTSEMFGASYARTLSDWRERFHRAWPAIAALGFDERFRRLWTYYLAYCEAGFDSRVLDVGLYQLQRPLESNAGQ